MTNKKNKHRIKSIYHSQFISKYLSSLKQKVVKMRCHQICNDYVEHKNRLILQLMKKNIVLTEFTFSILSFSTNETQM